MSSKVGWRRLCKLCDDMKVAVVAMSCAIWLKFNPLPHPRGISAFELATGCFCGPRKLKLLQICLDVLGAKMT